MSRTSLPDQHDCNGRTGTGACASLPDLIRMNYFHGQLLSPRDFLAEQAYLRNKLKLLNRCLHGYGVVCGLEIVPIPTEDPCAPQDADVKQALDRKIAEIERRLDDAKAAARKCEGKELERLKEEIARLQVELERARRAREEKGGYTGQISTPTAVRVQVECGVALDCHGNELVVRDPIAVDVVKLLSPAERAQLETGGEHKLYLSLCYTECGFEATRPMSIDDCGMTVSCRDARIREGVCIKGSLAAPPDDERCEHCCSDCGEACVPLSAITLRPGAGITAADIDNGVRRSFGLYQPTVITGVSWEHGATYTSGEAALLLGTDNPAGGIVVHFSRPIRADTVRPGVFDLWRINGGRGVAGIISHIQGDYVGVPTSGFVTQVRYRDTTEEKLQPADRVIVIVRGSHLLDKCCQPVASAHLGGRIPPIGVASSRSARDATSCPHPPGGFGPWTTGTGQTFESWFYISRS